MCRGRASAPTATQHETSTKRVHDAVPPTESLPTQCQPDSSEDNRQLSQPLRSSDSTSMCCDYHQAAAAKPLDDQASAAAQPKNRTLAAVR